MTDNPKVPPSKRMRGNEWLSMGLFFATMAAVLWWKLDIERPLMTICFTTLCGAVVLGVARSFLPAEEVALLFGVIVLLSIFLGMGIMLGSDGSIGWHRSAIFIGSVTLAIFSLLVVIGHWKHLPD